MVLALALPFDFPHREQLIVLTFGVVLLSLLLQGMTMSRLLTRLGLIQRDDHGVQLDHARGELQLIDGATTELARMERARLVTRE
jgi:monovalent cation:H+ antiporter, CPA1 family